MLEKYDFMGKSINYGLQKAYLFYDVILHRKHFMWC